MSRLIDKILFKNIMSASLFLIILLITLSGCCNFLKITNNKSSIQDKCSYFVITIDNADSGQILFYSKLKDSLDDRFNILSNEVDNSKVCTIKITKINKSIYTPLTSNSGIASRNNIKIDIYYTLNILNQTINNNCVLFYGKNISENYYSANINNKKTIDNDVNILSEKIFYSVMRDINNIKNFD